MFFRSELRRNPACPLLIGLLLSSATLHAQTTLQWNGNVNSNWDFATANWLSGASSVLYTNGAAVLFSDSAAGTTNINLTTTLQPTWVTVSNSAKSYLFAGPGAIGGSGGLTKRNSGSLTISANNNTYTGPNLLTNGTIVVTNVANGGAPSALGASSANPTNLVLAGATLSYRGSPVATDRGYSVAGN